MTIAWAVQVMRVERNCFQMQCGIFDDEAIFVLLTGQRVFVLAACEAVSAAAAGDPLHQNQALQCFPWPPALSNCTALKVRFIS